VSRRNSRNRPGQKEPVEDARKHPPKPAHTKITLSFEHYAAGERFCLSQYEGEKIQSFLDCLRKLTERTWQQLVEGSSKDSAMKTGLNSTPYERSDLRNPDIWPGWLDQDKTLLGVRATQKRRVFGVRIDNVFHVIWFDAEHGIVEG
jgi:hypothetical protein